MNETQVSHAHISHAHDRPRAYRVLVVEDEGLIAHDIARRLEAQGHEVLGPASTAEEALALAPGAEIVLMDIRIDGARDGIDAALEIRARHHLPVIFLTAHADRATLERAKQAGPFGYIVKPLGPASLQTGIEMAIAKHRVDRLLEEREAWLRAVVGSIAEAAIVVDPDGRVRLLNGAAEKLTGWTQTEAEGQPLQTVARFANPGAESDFDSIPLALLRGGPVAFGRDARMLSRDGREIDVDGFAAPVRASGELLGAVLTFRDASARHWEERQLRQAQRLEAAGRLAANAACEYSTLIDTIRRQNEVLLRQFGGLSGAREALESIHRAALAATEMTRRLEAFGTRQVGQPEAIPVNGLLRRMSRLIESASGGRVRLAMRPSPGAGRVRADAAQMESAILGLIAHACRMTPEGGHVLIDTANVELPHAGRPVSYVVLGITYTGVEAEIDRLFDPASTEVSSLALAQVHWLAAESGGYVSARAIHSANGGGTRIELLLPRLGDQALITGGDGQLASALEAATILLVEHNDAVRAEIHNFFEAAGHNLIEAADTQEAVALGEMHQEGLDLVIAPEAHASEIARRLHGFHPGLRALSVVETQGAVERLAPNQIRRPFTERELLEKVSGLLEQRAEEASPAAV